MLSCFGYLYLLEYELFSDYLDHEDVGHKHLQNTSDYLPVNTI